MTLMLLIWQNKGQVCASKAACVITGRQKPKSTAQQSFLWARASFSAIHNRGCGIKKSLFNHQIINLVRFQGVFNVRKSPICACQIVSLTAACATTASSELQKSPLQEGASN